ncbi:receptor-activated Ca2+-permeable cation channel [Amanita rubescens]|nr:receptor-activated Ca2+-permeable cation channel [Amanita rubescens]
MPICSVNSSSLHDSMPESERQPLLRFNDEVERTPVFPVISMIRSVRTSAFPLTAPDLTYTLIRPLVDKYSGIQNSGNMSVVFCCLLNRVYFSRDDNLATMTLSQTRALLCEILAIRLFKQYGNDVLALARVLTTTWGVYNGGDSALIARAREERDGDLDDRVGNAIELAILGKAKRFIKSSSCQKVIDSIWSGRCVYQAESSHSILSDTYKRTPIHFYDPHKAPLLDHYRLKVPSIRSVLEYLNFLVLFVLFIFALEYNERDELNAAEITFMIYAFGFSLERIAAMQEHGIKVYFKGTWNGFDMAFVTLFSIYTFLRLYGTYHPHGELTCPAGEDKLDIVIKYADSSLMGCRLAFVTLKNNLMVLSLHAMITQFLFLMFLAAFCFCGFLYALWTLAKYKAGTIAWWMLDLWFGLDASGFDRSSQFHPTFGPILMVTYACFSNTLLLTVLILTNTFANISEDAVAEAMFRKAVSTIEGVKADFLFSYQPPVNLIALCVLLPASYVLSPRWFHKLYDFTALLTYCRLTNFPFLLLIALYERQAKTAETTGFSETLGAMFEKALEALPRPLRRLGLLEALAGSDSDIDVVFEVVELAESEGAYEQHDSPPAQRPRRYSTIAAVNPLRSYSPLGMPRNSRNSSRPPDNAQGASPLVQLYPPLTVEGDIVGEFDEDRGTSSPTVVNYGPKIRKRPTSAKRTIPDSKPRTFPTSDGAMLSPNLLLSASPVQVEVFENDMSKTVEEIEKRQRRMEDLLNVIARRLESGTEHME